MGLLGFAKPPKRVEGYIGHFRLEKWWLTSFSQDERRYVQTMFQPLGAESDPLTTGHIGTTSQTSVGFLGALAGWFWKQADRPIARKILDKASEIAKTGTVLDRHFLCQQKIEVYYKDRDKPEYLARAVEACKEQIAMAPASAKAFLVEYYYDSFLPGHKGYQQLAIILEKAARFQEAIALSRQAKSQGWAGDWDRRVERCEKKLKSAFLEKD